MVSNLNDTLFERLSPEDSDEVMGVVSRIVGKKSGASDWTLQKTYFLAAVESIEDRLVALPSPLFFSWKFGPWSKDLRQLVDMAAEVGDLEIAMVSSKRRGSTKLYKLPRGKKLEPMRNTDNESFLDSFLASASKLSGDDLTKFAKETVPFRRTMPDRPIDLDAYLSERRAALEQLSDDTKLAEILASRAR